MKSYDPAQPPDPDVWSGLSESRRLALVTRYHFEQKAPLPNARLHAAIHVTVENQAAQGDGNAIRVTLERLVHEGLERHEAIHAIGSVLAGLVWSLQGDAPPGPDPNSSYREELQGLSAAGWRARERGGRGE